MSCRAEVSAVEHFPIWTRKLLHVESSPVHQHIHAHTQPPISKVMKMTVTSRPHTSLHRYQPQWIMTCDYIDPYDTSTQTWYSGRNNRIIAPMPWHALTVILDFTAIHGATCHSEFNVCTPRGMPSPHPDEGFAAVPKLKLSCFPRLPRSDDAGSGSEAWRRGTKKLTIRHVSRRVAIRLFQKLRGWYFMTIPFYGKSLAIGSPCKALSGTYVLEERSSKFFARDPESGIWSRAPVTKQRTFFIESEGSSSVEQFVATGCWHTELRTWSPLEILNQLAEIL